MTNTAAIEAAAAALLAAKEALEAAKAADVIARAEMLAAMQSEGLARAVTASGIVSACKGRRTVTVTDPALAAEIKLLKERGVRTGRCSEAVGDPYVVLRAHR